jgi:hypothetical protein
LPPRAARFEGCHRWGATKSQLENMMPKVWWCDARVGGAPSSTCRSQSGFDLGRRQRGHDDVGGSVNEGDGGSTEADGEADGNEANGNEGDDNGSEGVGDDRSEGHDRSSARQLRRRSKQRRPRATAVPN